MSYVVNVFKGCLVSRPRDTGGDVTKYQINLLVQFIMWGSGFILITNHQMYLF